MEFVDIPFPERIAFGAQSDPLWSTTVVPVLSGVETAVQNWSDAKHTYNCALVARHMSEYAEAREHFHQVRGRAKSFPFKDFLDFEVAATEGVVLTLAGVAPTANGTFYLHKRYGSGASAYDRQITRPDTPIVVFRNGGNITGSGAAITYAGGIVVITGHTGGDVYTWSGTFKVPCRYAEDKLPAAAINKNEGELLVDCGPFGLVEVREFT